MTLPVPFTWPPPVPPAFASGISSDDVLNTSGVPGSSVTDALDALNTDVTALESGTRKEPVRALTATNVALSGLITTDGVTLVAGDRVGVVAQTNAPDNGIWIAAAGAWTRASDANTSALVKAGMTFYVEEGTSFADTVLSVTTNNPIVLGTTPIAFELLMRGTGTPTTVTTLGAASVGSGTKYAPFDHVHPIDSFYQAISNFRLSTVTGSSIPTDGSTFSTVFLAAHNGNRIALYDGTKWVDHVLSASVSLALSGMTSGLPQDIFAVSGGSRTTVTLERTQWTNTTTRATAITQQDGTWVKSGSLTRRYLGTILANSTTTFAHTQNPAAGTKSVCGLWNQDNRIRSGFTYLMPAGTATPGSSGVWATPGGASAPHFEAMIGQVIDSYTARALCGVTITTSGQQAAIGIGSDSTSAVGGIRGMSVGTGAANTTTLSAHRTIKASAVGVRTVNMLAQVSATGPTLILGQDLVQSGLVVDHWY